MSSMRRRALASILLTTVASPAFPAAAQAPAAPTAQAAAPQAAQAPAQQTGTDLTATYNAADWDRARANLVARAPGRMAQAVRLWQQLTASNSYSFGDYANFLLSYPGLPDADKLQGYAEDRLRTEGVANDRLVAFFDKYPPVSNFARARYALALQAVRPQSAFDVARAAWRGGQMDPAAESSLLAVYGSRFTQDDQDARMDALLWQRDADEAARQIARVSPAKLPVFQARLAIIQGGDGFTLAPGAMSDPGYLYNRSRELRTEGNLRSAVDLLANHPPLASLPFDPTAWVSELLAVARVGGSQDAVKIASTIDQAFAPGTKISDLPYKLRDDYTSLMWLGATKAWQLGQPSAAVPLFYRYGYAAKTSPTRSKGLFWAAQAAQSAGDQANAQRYYQLAAQYPDRFYGQMARERLGQPIAFQSPPTATPTPAERAAFLAKPLTQAVTEVARDAPWSVGIKFYREIADQADTVDKGVLVSQLARDIGRRDLAVILANAADSNGFSGFTALGFPTLVTPAGVDWTMVHAISRQESQFADNAVSYAGARGMMQLMPRTAEEQANKIGIQYMSASLVNDPAYNVRLGDAYFQRMLRYYNGSYPLAVAAYNAGPGNVNKWLRQNGDPRTGAVDWLRWIEEIPYFETKNYVQRVLENAVVYDAINPSRARTSPAIRLSYYLGKSSRPG
jgi:soluble lytic murein transglycosylase